MPFLPVSPFWLFASEGGGGGGLGLTERMMHRVIQIGVILFAARVGNMAFEKCRMPGVLGESCIGILIGPSLAIVLWVLITTKDTKSTENEKLNSSA